MHLPNNTLLQGGKYKITRFIASGGFGCTYEAVHTMLDTKVAIKEFFPKMFCNRDENTSHVTVATQGNRDLVAKLRKKFNEEAIAVFRMSHPNIVRVLDVFEENGTAYYVMEYVDGKSLNEMVKERGALPEAEAVGYIRQVAEALKYVHSLNRLHLDIKPGNIMIDKNGKAILIDFGASKHYDDESGENTSTLMGVNTVGYAPLEQLNQSFTSFSPATDIYALGATLYKLLTTITPPSALSLVSEDEELIPLSKSISFPIRNAVDKAMELKRKRRFQIVNDFIVALESKDIHSEVMSYENNKTIVNEETEVTQIDSAYSAYETIEDVLSEEDLSDSKSVNIDVHDEFEGVDLGLPSGILWGKSNLGANTEYDSGEYFVFCANDSYENGCVTTSQQWLKLPANTNISLISDIAHNRLGKGWRTPSKEDFDELKDNCIFEWNNSKGKTGLIVTGPNGKTIFLPASGYKFGNIHYDNEKLGLYRCSTVAEEKVSTYFGYIHSGGINIYKSGRINDGFSIRPVKCQ